MLIIRQNWFGTLSQSKKFTVVLIAVLSVAALSISNISHRVSAQANQPQPADSHFQWIVEDHANSHINRATDISADGRFVLFNSYTAFIPEDTNNDFDVYLKDLSNGSVVRVSTNPDGSQRTRISAEAAMSSNGKYVLFTAFDGDYAQTYVWQRNVGVKKVVEQGYDGNNITGSVYPISVSDNGIILFTTFAHNIVPELSTGAGTIVKDQVRGTARLLTIQDPNHAGHTWLISDGYVSADGTNAVITGSDLTANLRTAGGALINEVLSVNLTTGESKKVTPNTITPTVSQTYYFVAVKGGVSASGRYALFVASDHNVLHAPNKASLYMRDLQTGIISPVDNPANGLEPNGGARIDFASISDDGRFIGFGSNATNLDESYDPIRVPDSGGFALGSLYVRDMTKSSPTMVANQIGPLTAAYSTATNTFAFSTSQSIDDNDTGGYDVYLLQYGDKLPPVVMGTASRLPDNGVWYNHDVTINWSATDPAPSSGQPTIPASTVVSSEGQNVPYTSGQSCDPAGNCSTGTFNVSLDKTTPILGAPSWSANPKTVSTASTLTVAATDSLSSVSSGEYFIGNDPGVGNGAAMPLANGSLSASFGSNFVSGVYSIGVRAKDNAGNWSATTTTMLVVYNPAGPGVTGKNKKDLVPSLSRGDILPGLVDSTQTDVADYGFTAAYTNGNLNPGSDLQFTYATGTNCKKATASNCHTFNLNATSFDWLVIDQANNSRGRYQGVATLTIDGVTTTNPFTVEAVDGDLVNNTSADTLLLKVYPSGANPTAATAIYQASGPVGRGNGVRIR